MVTGWTRQKLGWTSRWGGGNWGDDRQSNGASGRIGGLQSGQRAGGIEPWKQA
jgi:hypothetical protein